MARIDNTTRQALIDARHAALCERPDMTHHDVGCERAECVDRCEGGYCQCAGCEAHMDDYVATLEELSPSQIADVLEAHGVAAKAFWAAAGVDPIELPVASVMAALAEAQA